MHPPSPRTSVCSILHKAVNRILLQMRIIKSENRADMAQFRSLKIGAELASTGQGMPSVARRGASLPRKKDAQFITATPQFALAA